MNLAGKNAIVTGSTSGIGLGIATALANAGCNIVLNGLGDLAEVEDTRADLATRSGKTILYSDANMMKADQIHGMIAMCVKELGSIDILVNNAGIQHVAPIEEFPFEKWDAILSINLSAVFHSIQAAAPHMKAQGSGRIINIASAHALVASPYKSAYVAAKHGVAGLTKTVALELAEDGITANAVCPGYVLTPLVAGQIPDTAKARGMTEDEVKKDVLLAAQPTKEFVTTEQVGSFVTYLASDAAASITGAVLPIDGGWTAQ